MVGGVSPIGQVSLHVSLPLVGYRMLKTRIHRCGSIDTIPPGACRSVETEVGWVALYNVNGEIFATEDACPHAGGPLGEGQLTGDCVACPWHGWRFNVKTGVRVENADFRVQCFAVRIEDGEIVLELPTEPSTS